MAYLLPSLLCPLMMLVCMGGFRLPWKRRAGRVTPSLGLAAQDRAEEIASLRLQQAELSRRLEALATESSAQDDDMPSWRAAG